MIRDGEGWYWWLIVFQKIVQFDIFFCLFVCACVISDTWIAFNVHKIASMDL